MLIIVLKILTQFVKIMPKMLHLLKHSFILNLLKKLFKIILIEIFKEFILKNTFHSTINKSIVTCKN